MAHINASGQVDNALGLLARVQTARVNISSAQLLNFTTPVQLLPSPGANMFFLVVAITVQTKPGTVAYGGGGNITAVYTSTVTPCHASFVPAAAVISATPTNNLLPPNAAVVQPPANTGVTISAATNFTSGNGTLVVKVSFVVITVD